MQFDVSDLYQYSNSKIVANTIITQNITCNENTKKAADKSAVQVMCVFNETVVDLKKAFIDKNCSENLTFSIVKYIAIFFLQRIKSPIYI